MAANRVEGPLAGIRRPSSAGVRWRVPRSLFCIDFHALFAYKLSDRHSPMGEYRAETGTTRGTIPLATGSFTGKPGRQHDGQPERGHKIDFAVR